VGAPSGQRHAAAVGRWCGGPMLRKLGIALIVLLAAAAVALTLVAQPSPKRAAQAPAQEIVAQAVTVARVEWAHFTETVPVTGSLAAREEGLGGPEAQGLP